MTETPQRYDVAYHSEYATIEPHFCREWDEDGGCYGTNPNHGYSFDDACEEVASWHSQQADLWRKREHHSCLYYTAQDDELSPGSIPMTTVPDDVRAKAEAVYKELADTCIYGAYDDNFEFEKPKAAAVIAAALMQERERCAKIADSFAEPLDPEFAVNRQQEANEMQAAIDAARDIAAFIRTPDPA